MTLPRIGITLGDPGGIGPEITLKALALENSLPEAHYIIYGSALVLEEEIKRGGFNIKIPVLEGNRFCPVPSVTLQEIPTPTDGIQTGQYSKASGQASFRFFEKAVQQAQDGLIQALVTAPISKKSWEMAGIQWSGHTDYLSHTYPQAVMSFWSDKLKVVLYTHHIPLKESLQRINKKDLLDFFIHLDQNIQNLQPQRFRFLVAGLNPHAGEGGLIGSEEKEEILPAVEQAQRQGVKINGPFPPDTVFRQALLQPDKIVIALYHDQGLIPFKLESFEDGVNLTLGLPFVRTSPDHGTAFDIAGQNKANPQSLIKSIELAYSLSQPL
jgi:4-hydroxythreonine-4-phosphate dehydrogenase